MTDEALDLAAQIGSIFKSALNAARVCIRPFLVGYLPVASYFQTRLDAQSLLTRSMYATSERMSSMKTIPNATKFLAIH